MATTENALAFVRASLMRRSHDVLAAAVDEPQPQPARSSGSHGAGGVSSNDSSRHKSPSPSSHQRGRRSTRRSNATILRAASLRTQPTPSPAAAASKTAVSLSAAEASDEAAPMKPLPMTPATHIACSSSSGGSNPTLHGGRRPMSGAVAAAPLTELATPPPCRDTHDRAAEVMAVGPTDATATPRVAVSASPRVRTSLVGASLIHSTGAGSGVFPREVVAFTGSRHASVHDPLQLSPAAATPSRAAVVSRHHSNVSAVSSSVWLLPHRQRRPSSCSFRAGSTHEPRVRRVSGVTDRDDVAVYDAGLAEAMIRTARRMSLAERHEKEQQEQRLLRGSTNAVRRPSLLLKEGGVAARKASQRSRGEEGMGSSGSGGGGGGFVQRLRKSVSSLSPALPESPPQTFLLPAAVAVPSGVALSSSPSVSPSWRASSGVGVTPPASAPSRVGFRCGSRHGGAGASEDGEGLAHHPPSDMGVANSNNEEEEAEDVAASFLRALSTLSPNVPISQAPQLHPSSSATQLSHKLLTEAFYGNYLSSKMARDAYLHFLSEAQGGGGGARARRRGSNATSHRLPSCGVPAEGKWPRRRCLSAASDLRSRHGPLPVDRDGRAHPSAAREDRRAHDSVDSAGVSAAEQTPAAAAPARPVAAEDVFWTPASSSSAVMLSPVPPSEHLPMFLQRQQHQRPQQPFTSPPDSEAPPIPSPRPGKTCHPPHVHAGATARVALSGPLDSSAPPPSSAAGSGGGAFMRYPSSPPSPLPHHAQAPSSSEGSRSAAPTSTFTSSSSASASASAQERIEDLLRRSQAVYMASIHGH